MIGAADVSSTSQNVWSETCEMSTSMPRRFISWITERPKSDSPRLASLPEDPAQGVSLLCVSVR